MKILFETVESWLSSGYKKFRNQTLTRRKTMTRKEDSRILGIVHPICCGLDVHKEKVSACVISSDRKGNEQIVIKEFETFTDDLIDLRGWLLDLGCPVTAVESTGIYWRPVYNILEGYMRVVLVNAREIKNVPGRKTDIADSKWLAGLLRYGLLRGSFIPEIEVRQWRDLTRLRKKYVLSIGDYKRRTQKLFESANIKVDSVVSDLFGVTGRNLMNLLSSNRQAITQEEVASCVRGKLKGKEDELYRSIQGFFTEHHRFLLKTLLRTIQSLESDVARLEKRISVAMKPTDDIADRLQKIPGISETASHDILSELGPNLATFSNASSLASWAGLCPGNNESAGKRKSGRSPVRKHHLKTIMVEAAHAAVRKNGSYYKDKYYRLKAKCGARKAIVAIAHRMLKAVYYIIKEGATFIDLGESYLALRNKERKLKYIRKQAGLLGFQLIPENA